MEPYSSSICLKLMSIKLDFIKIDYGTAKVKYVREGNTIILNCSATNDPSWRFNGAVISIGPLLSPGLKDNPRFAIRANATDGEYRLQIDNVNKADEGIYWCIASTGDVRYFLKLMRPPFGIRILNASSGVMYAKPGATVNLTCTVHSGEPLEQIAWYRGNDLLASGSEALTINFTIHKRTLFYCRVYHDALDEPLEKTIEILLESQPIVKLLAIPSSQLNLADNVSLLCQVDNPIELTSISWTKDGRPLSNRALELDMVNVKKSDKGQYNCTVGNIYGDTTSSINLQILDYTNNITTNSSTARTRRNGFTRQSILLVCIPVFAFNVCAATISTLKVFRTLKFKIFTPQNVESQTTSARNSDYHVYFEIAEGDEEQHKDRSIANLQVERTLSENTRQMANANILTRETADGYLTPC